MRRRPIVHPMRPEQRNRKFRTICEVQRQAWRYVERRVRPKDAAAADALQGWLEEAYDLGKRMHYRLATLKEDYIDKDGLFEKKLPGDDKFEDLCSA